MFFPVRFLRQIGGNNLTRSLVFRGDSISPICRSVAISCSLRFVGRRWSEFLKALSSSSLTFVRISSTFFGSESYGGVMFRLGSRSWKPVVHSSVGSAIFFVRIFIGCCEVADFTALEGSGPKTLLALLGSFQRIHELPWLPYGRSFAVFLQIY